MVGMKNIQLNRNGAVKESKEGFVELICFYDD